MVNLWCLIILFLQGQTTSIKKKVKIIPTNHGHAFTFLFLGQRHFSHGIVHVELVHHDKEGSKLTLHYILPKPNTMSLSPCKKLEPMQTKKVNSPHKRRRR
jgi:hypothetical protein